MLGVGEVFKVQPRRGKYEFATVVVIASVEYHVRLPSIDDALSWPRGHLRTELWVEGFDNRYIPVSRAHDSHSEWSAVVRVQCLVASHDFDYPRVTRGIA